MTKRQSSPRAEPDSAPPPSPRERVLGAAFDAFTQNGYAGTSTLAVATRAKVSKRELYAHFGSKQALLVACIDARLPQILSAADLPVPRDRDELAAALTTFGVRFLHETCHTSVIALFRVAVAEAERSPEVAQALDTEARQATRAALGAIFRRAETDGLIASGNPAAMAEQFFALLWGDLMVGLLLGVAAPPGRAEIERHASGASAAFLTLHPSPST